MASGSIPPQAPDRPLRLDLVKTATNEVLGSIRLQADELQQALSYPVTAHAIFRLIAPFEEPTGMDDN